jgi:hypothetical protein
MQRIEYFVLECRLWLSGARLTENLVPYVVESKIPVKISEN